jgi:hypothetical protein
MQRVSKDEATARASWFETQRCALLLTMRIEESVRSYFT